MPIPKGIPTTTERAKPQANSIPLTINGRRATRGVAFFLRHPLELRTQTYLFFTVDSFDCIGKNFSAWQACDRLEGTYGAVAEQGQRLRIAAKSIVDSMVFGVDSIRLN
jgi:hypothetical protein